MEKYEPLKLFGPNILCMFLHLNCDLVMMQQDSQLVVHLDLNSGTFIGMSFSLLFLLSILLVCLYYIKDYD